MGVDSIVRVLSRKQATGVLLICSWRKNGASMVNRRVKLILEIRRNMEEIGVINIPDPL